MSQQRYIKVLLPLKLDWEPVYALPEGISIAVGAFIEVDFAHKKYLGVVTAVDVVPEPGVDVKMIETPERVGGDGASLPTVFGNLSPLQLEFWHQLSTYYLCTPGEVFKAATQQSKKSIKKSRKKQALPTSPGLSSPSSPGLSRGSHELELIHSAFSKGKTVLLQGQNCDIIYRQLEQETIAEGKSVLHLVPSKKRLILEPVQNLGLVIVEDEHDASYKQDSPAPRFNAREAAIMLARLHGANVLLTSPTPSLESLHNAEIGLFEKVQLKESLKPDITLINTSAETRKKGMSGDFSFKLLEVMNPVLEAGKKVLLVCRSKQAIPEIIPEGAVPATPLTVRTLNLTGFSLIVVLHGESLLGKEDFRSDERALQFLQHLASKAPLVIQSRETKHPVFKALKDGLDSNCFLDERRLANLPPFTRLVNIVIRDHSEKRINYLSNLLVSMRCPDGAGHDGAVTPDLFGSLQILGPYTPSYQQEGEYIRIIRITLPKDKSLKPRKEAIYQAIKTFEKQYKYTGHIVIDVDPV